MYKITIKSSILAERSHGSPVRFTVGQQIIGDLHTVMRGDLLLCFHVTEIGDFVYFPTEAVTYEPLTQGTKDAHRKSTRS